MSGLGARRLVFGSWGRAVDDVESDRERRNLLPLCKGPPTLSF